MSKLERYTNFEEMKQASRTSKKIAVKKKKLFDGFEEFIKKLQMQPLREKPYPSHGK